MFLNRPGESVQKQQLAMILLCQEVKECICPNIFCVLPTEQVHTQCPSEPLHNTHGTLMVQYNACKARIQRRGASRDRTFASSYGNAMRILWMSCLQALQGKLRHPSRRYGPAVENDTLILILDPYTTFYGMKGCQL